MPDQKLESSHNAAGVANLEPPVPQRSHFTAPSSEKKGHKWVWALVLIALAVVGILYYQRHSSGDASKAKAAAPPRAVPITTSSTRQGDIGVYVEALGAVTPVYTVTVTSRVQGQIMEVHYTEGQMVKKNDPLLEIDPRPYEAALTQAQGQLAHDQATLAEARIDLDRYKSAFARNAIAQQQVYDQEQAVLQDQGTVQNDEGTVENARVNLSYTHIASPIDGRVGLRLVDPGNIVQANSTTPLVVITQLQPITVIFSVAEDYVPQIMKQLRQSHSMPVTALDRTQEQKIATGSLLTLDNQIDPTTGTVKLKAIFDNKDDALFPNQFVNARLLVQTEHDATLVPTAAVQRNAQGAILYVVMQDDTAQIVTIKTGTSDGNDTAVQGVQPNQTVAISGFDRLQDGVPVAVRGEGNGAAGKPDGANSAEENAPKDQKTDAKKNDKGGSQGYKKKFNGDATP